MKDFFNYGDNWTVIISRFAIGTFFLLAGFSPHLDIVPFSGFEAQNYGLFGIEPSSPVSIFFDVSMILIGVAFINNMFVATALMFVYPIALFMIIANFMVSPVLGGLSLLAIIPIGVLTYFYRKVYKVFLHPQIYVNPMGEKTSDIIVIDEVREKAPRYFRLVQKIHSNLKHS